MFARAALAVRGGRNQSPSSARLEAEAAPRRGRPPPPRPDSASRSGRWVPVAIVGGIRGTGWGCEARQGGEGSLGERGRGKERERARGACVERWARRGAYVGKGSGGIRGGELGRLGGIGMGYGCDRGNRLSRLSFGLRRGCQRRRSRLRGLCCFNCRQRLLRPRLSDCRRGLGRLF